MTVGTTQAGKREFVKGHYLAADFGTALLVATIVGVGAWQASGSDAQGTVSAPHRGAAVASTRDDVSVINYLVASQAQAEFIARGEYEAATIRAQSGIDDGEPQDEVQVWIVNDEASLAFAMRGFMDANAVRIENGLAETALVDLRALLR